jgi:hypothetical protein
MGRLMLAVALVVLAVAFSRIVVAFVNVSLVSQGLSGEAMRTSIHARPGESDGYESLAESLEHVAHVVHMF